MEISISVPIFGSDIFGDNMAGYSGTPADQETGDQRRFSYWAGGSPKGFQKELGSLPNAAKFVSCLTNSLDMIILFVRSEAELKKKYTLLAANLSAKGVLWVAWPKKSSVCLPIFPSPMFKASVYTRG